MGRDLPEGRGGPTSAVLIRAKELIGSVPFAFVSWLLIPHLPSKLHANRTAKWKLLDIPGSLLILAALTLLNVGLTLGASRGWVNARFLVPTILSLPLAIAFFVWEYRVGEVKALIPVSLWKINNIALMSWVALGLFPYMAVSRPRRIRRCVVSALLIAVHPAAPRRAIPDDQRRVEHQGRGEDVASRLGHVPRRHPRLVSVPHKSARQRLIPQRYPQEDCEHAMGHWLLPGHCRGDVRAPHIRRRIHHEERLLVILRPCIHRRFSRIRHCLSGSQVRISTHAGELQLTAASR